MLLFSTCGEHLKYFSKGVYVYNKLLSQYYRSLLSSSLLAQLYGTHTQPLWVPSRAACGIHFATRYGSHIVFAYESHLRSICKFKKNASASQLILSPFLLKLALHFMPISIQYPQ